MKQAAPGKPKGEVYVWITAMGLAIALSMILFLLGLIIANGVSVFWPRKVALVTVEEASSSVYRGSRQVAGVILEEKPIDPRDLSPEQQESADPADRREKKLFLGNRETYGVAFTYINAGDVEAIRYPDEIIRAERLEWGDAIFFPLRLRLADGRVIEGDSEKFKLELRARVQEVSKRREQIERIERSEIGRINMAMRDLELEARYYRQQEQMSASQQADLAKIEQQLADLQARYQPLAERAQELRSRQREHILDYRLATGEERSVPVGELVGFYYPNHLSLGERVIHFFKHAGNFLSGFPREANTEGGIFPAIFGTLVMTLIMSIAVTPFGVLAAIYLREYARQGTFVRSVRIAINNLAGVPSIVFGIFGLGFFVYFLGGAIDQWFFPKALASNTPTFGTGGILWASLTLALMTVPVVIVATEEALAAVPRGVREGSLACGASKWQTIQRLVLPASAPGILTGLILAMARGAGEVAPLMLVGVVALAPNLPIDDTFPFIHLERKFMHLGFHIFDLGFQSPDSEAAKPMVFATTLVLIALVIILNLGAIFVRNRLRRKYAAATF